MPARKNPAAIVAALPQRHAWRSAANPNRQRVVHVIARAGLEDLQCMRIEARLKSMRREGTCRHGKCAVDRRDEQPDAHAQPQPPCP